MRRPVGFQSVTGRVVANTTTICVHADIKFPVHLPIPRSMECSDIQITSVLDIEMAVGVLFDSLNSRLWARDGK